VQDTGRAIPPALRRLLVILCLATLASLSKSSSGDEPAAITSRALVGTWRLVSVEERQPNGETTYWMGRRPLGLLIYDRAGNVSVQIMRDPSLTTPPANHQDGYYAYFGRYDVREREATVVHRVQGSMRPSEIGVAYTRSVRLSGDRLVLGLSPTRTLTWQRLK
jgi:lipocalin-like protein